LLHATEAGEKHQPYEPLGWNADLTVFFLFFFSRYYDTDNSHQEMMQKIFESIQEDPFCF